MHFWSKKSLQKRFFRLDLDRPYLFLVPIQCPVFTVGEEKGRRKIQGCQVANLQKSQHLPTKNPKVHNFFLKKDQKTKMISTFLMGQTKFIINGVFQASPLATLEKEAEKKPCHIFLLFSEMQGGTERALLPCLPVYVYSAISFSSSYFSPWESMGWTLDPTRETFFEFMYFLKEYASNFGK